MTWEISGEWCMDHVWELWYMPKVMASPPMHPRHALLSPWVWVELQNCTSTRWWSCPRGVIQVSICYQTMKGVLGDELTMSDMWITSQGSWFHLQLDLRHAQMSPWFSDQASNLDLYQVMKLYNEDYAGLYILSYYGISVGWCKDEDNVMSHNYTSNHTFFQET